MKMNSKRAMALALESLELWKRTYPNDWEQHDEDALEALRETIHLLQTPIPEDRVRLLALNYSGWRLIRATEKEHGIY
jgi:hypothetical protein